MNKRKWRRKYSFVSSACLLAWVIFAQSCMKFRISDSKAKEQFSISGVELHTATTRIDGFNMHYVKTGDDIHPTLFFVHGSPGSWDVYKRYMQDKDLLASFRMIAVDRPGFGYSEFGNAKNLAEQSKLITALIKQLNNNQPIFAVGHSLGGPVVVKLEADHPDLFAGIVLLAASVDPHEEKAEKWRPWLFKTPLNYLVPGAFAPSNEELWYLKKDLVDLKSDFKKIKCPVWIIHGDKDILVPVGNAEYAKQMLVNASAINTTIIHGANHFIPWQHYVEIKKVLLDLR